MSLYVVTLRSEFSVPEVQSLKHPGWASPGDALELRGIQGREVLAPCGKMGDDFRVAEILALDEREQPGQLTEDGVHAVLAGGSGHSG
jgi:hypothetical protein